MPIVPPISAPWIAACTHSTLPGRALFAINTGVSTGPSTCWERMSAPCVRLPASNAAVPTAVALWTLATTYTSLGSRPI
jgi:hypothetical protein